MAIHTFVQWPLVSPTNCLLQLLQEIRYTTFSVVQSVFCLSLTVAPEDDFTVPAEVIILQQNMLHQIKAPQFDTDLGLQNTVESSC